MLELRSKGPVLFDFKADSTFGAYKHGILTEPTQKEQDPDTVTNKRWLDDLGVEWQYLTHSCLLIGWGYDKQLKMKYWVVRNSYGPQWGERGNFRVRRGMNDFGCESEVAAISPLLF